LEIRRQRSRDDLTSATSPLAKPDRFPTESEEIVVEDKKSTLKKQDSQKSLTGKKRRSETPKLEKPVDSSVQGELKLFSTRSK
jgi:hypothetical protein